MRPRCALCLVSEDLRRSHLIPKWAYKRILDFTSTKSDPVTIQNGRAKASSLQVWEDLLCASCEEILSRPEGLAETFACATDGSSPLFSLPRLAMSAEPAVELVSGRTIDHEAMIHFGLALVWKCAVAKRGGSQCKLGSKYEKLIREYILGRIPLPDSVVVVLAVMKVEPNSSYHTVSLFPVTDRWETCHRTRVLVCGLHFDVYLGQQIGLRVREISISHNPDRPIALVPASQMGFLSKAKTSIIEARPTKKLAATGIWGDEQ